MSLKLTPDQETKLLLEEIDLIEYRERHCEDNDYPAVTVYARIKERLERILDEM